MPQRDTETPDGLIKKMNCLAHLTCKAENVAKRWLVK